MPSESQQLTGSTRGPWPLPLIISHRFGNLDSRTSVEIMAILQLLNQQGLTIVLVTHEPDIAEYTSRRVTFRDGRLIRDEPVQNPRDAQAEWAALAPTTPDITAQANTERKTPDVHH